MADKTSPEYELMRQLVTEISHQSITVNWSQVKEPGMTYIVYINKEKVFTSPIASLYTVLNLKPSTPYSLVLLKARSPEVDGQLPLQPGAETTPDEIEYTTSFISRKIVAAASITTQSTIIAPQKPVNDQYLQALGAAVRRKIPDEFVPWLFDHEHFQVALIEPLQEKISPETRVALSAITTGVHGPNAVHGGLYFNPGDKSFTIQETKVIGKIISPSEFVNAGPQQYHAAALVLNGEEFHIDGLLNEENLMNHLLIYDELKNKAIQIGLPIVVLIYGMENVDEDIQSFPETLRSSPRVNVMRAVIQSYLRTMLAMIVPLPPLCFQDITNHIYLLEAIMTIRSAAYIFCRGFVPHAILPPSGESYVKSIRMSSTSD